MRATVSTSVRRGRKIFLRQWKLQENQRTFRSQQGYDFPNFRVLTGHCLLVSTRLDKISYRFKVVEAVWKKVR